MDKFEALIRLATGVFDPSSDYLSNQRNIDRMKNPHNDHFKPKLRDTIEIIADYKVEMALLLYVKLSQEA